MKHVNEVPTLLSKPIDCIETPFVLFVVIIFTLSSGNPFGLSLTNTFDIVF